MSIFISILPLVMPAIWIVCGNYHRKNIPSIITTEGSLYRIKEARINNDTWNFAYDFWGRLSVNVGAILLLISTIPMFFAFGGNLKVASILSLIISVVNAIVYLCCYYFFLAKLKQVFDDYGFRRE